MGDIPRIRSELLTTAEVMAILGKERATVIKWGREGRIKIAGRVPGGTILYSRASVLAVAEQIAEDLHRHADELTERAAQ